jgi:hypothetical protein
MKLRKVGENCIMRSFMSCIIRIIKSRRMGRACTSSTNEKRNAFRILVEKPEGKRPLGR